MDLFGDGEELVLHAIEPTDRFGTFTPPEFVLRKPLIYDETCRILHLLHTTHGFSYRHIADAVGLRVRDVEYAVLVENAHLERNGVSCSSCSTLIDITYGATCPTCLIRKATS